MINKVQLRESNIAIKWLWLNHLDTTRHKILVYWYIVKVCIALLERAISHDLSKYRIEEAVSFRNWTQAMKGLTYGSDEYKKVSASFAKDNWIHYSVNRHHPQYWPNGIKDMSPIDLIEMLCDWKAKTATKHGISIIDSIEINSTTFNYDENMRNGLTRDAREAFN